MAPKAFSPVTCNSQGLTGYHLVPAFRQRISDPNKRKIERFSAAFVDIHFPFPEAKPKYEPSPH